MLIIEGRGTDAGQTAALRQDVQHLKGLVKAMAICGFVLVLANFGMDLWRRHDFETERTELRKTLDHVTTRVQASTFLMDEAGKVVRSLEERLAQVKSQVEQIGKTSSEAPTESAVNETPRGTQKLIEERPPVEILTASLDEVLIGLQVQGQDPFLTERYPKVLDPRTWNSAEIIKDLEQTFQASLSPKEHEFAERTIATYQSATETAYSSYQIDLDTSLAERTLENDFDLPLESGEFAAPKVPQDQILAVMQVGTRQYLWEKGHYPELHRKNMVYQYMPLAMLERLRRFFSERNGK